MYDLRHNPKKPFNFNFKKIKLKYLLILLLILILMFPTFFGTLLGNWVSGFFGTIIKIITNG